MVCDMPEPCKFPSLDSCQKSFLWTHKKVDLAPHPAIGLVLQVGDTAEFPHALGFQSLDNFFRVSKQGPCSTAVEKDGCNKRLVQPELVRTDGLAGKAVTTSGPRLGGSEVLRSMRQYPKAQSKRNQTWVA